MAELTCTVDPDGGGDYESLSAAEAAEQQDLTDGDGDTWVCTCTSSGGTADTTAVTFNGWTLAAANYIKIRAATGHEAVKTGWDDVRYRLVVTDAMAMTLSDDHIRAEGLQIREIYSSTPGRRCVYIVSVGAGSDIRISGCRVRGDTDGSANGIGIDSADPDAVVKVWNSIVYDCDVDGIQIDDGASALIANCIVYNCATNGIETDIAATIKNCAVFGNGDDFQDDSLSATIDYCASDDGDGTNAVAPSGSDWDNEFVDAANGDFTLVASGNCQDGGTDNPGSGLYSTDMDGDSYTSPWSIGVDEIVATGGPRGRALVGPFGGPLGGVA